MDKKVLLPLLKLSMKLQAQTLIRIHNFSYLLPGEQLMPACPKQPWYQFELNLKLRQMRRKKLDRASGLPPHLLHKPNLAVLLNRFQPPPRLESSDVFLLVMCSQPHLPLFVRRGSGIRTHDLFVPNEARYQTAPHPG